MVCGWCCHPGEPFFNLSPWSEPIIVLLFQFRYLEGLLKDSNEKQAARNRAFESLESMIKAAPELDYEQELASWRDERFAG